MRISLIDYPGIPIERARIRGRLLDQYGPKNVATPSEADGYDSGYSFRDYKKRLKTLINGLMNELEPHKLSETESRLKIYLDYCKPATVSERDCVYEIPFISEEQGELMRLKPSEEIASRLFYNAQRVPRYYDTRSSTHRYHPLDGKVTEFEGSSQENVVPIIELALDRSLQEGNSLEEAMANVKGQMNRYLRNCERVIIEVDSGYNVVELVPDGYDFPPGYIEEVRRVSNPEFWNVPLVHSSHELRRDEDMTIYELVDLLEVGFHPRLRRKIREELIQEPESMGYNRRFGVIGWKSASVVGVVPREDYDLDTYAKRASSRLNRIMYSLEKEGRLSVQTAKDEFGRFIEGLEDTVVTKHRLGVFLQTDEFYRLPYIPEDAVRKAA